MEGTMIKTRVIAPAAEAYTYPLLIKRLLLSGVRYQPGQEIVYADQLRYSYTTLQTRIQRLANVLTEAGVRPGDTVALLDWDSHRALECFFAVPMLGEPEFFIRKAIGWVLRAASLARPEQVEVFVAQQAAALSGLSFREATRRLPATARRRLEAQRASAAKLELTRERRVTATPASTAGRQRRSSLENARRRSAPDRAGKRARRAAP